MTDRALTPPELAKLWGITPSRVIKFIRSGELRGFDVSSRESVRPRWRIMPESIVEFENRRSAKPVVAQRRRNRVPDDIIKFF